MKLPLQFWFSFLFLFPFSQLLISKVLFCLSLQSRNQSIIHSYFNNWPFSSSIFSSDCVVVYCSSFLSLSLFLKISALKASCKCTCFFSYLLPHFLSLTGSSYLSHSILPLSFFLSLSLLLILSLGSATNKASPFLSLHRLLFSIHLSFLLSFFFFSLTLSVHIHR